VPAVAAGESLNFARLFLICGSAFGAVAVVLGAFGAHSLRARLDAPLLHAFETGVTYQFYHSIALCLLALWCRQLERVAAADAATVAGFAFIGGIGVFCGSLYALALGGPRWLGPVTPLGGIAFIVGWVAFAWSAWRH
jgi:uncharacterized membrane protein YgdD (TMEM256/DUF423 family)